MRPARLLVPLIALSLVFPPAWGLAEPIDRAVRRQAPGATEGMTRLVGQASGFEPYQSYQVGSWPESVAIGDVTGDGRNDVVMSTSYDFDPDNDFKLFLFVQNPDGTLSTPERFDTDAVHLDQMGLASSDLNGDGRFDVALATSGGVDLYLGGGARGLRRPRLIPTSSQSRHVEIADLEGDGDLDIFVAAGDGMLVLRRRDWGYRELTITRNLEEEIEVDDVTGDGLADLVGLTSDTLHVYAQRAGGGFGAPASYDCLTEYWPRGDGVGIGDVNGDGRQDVVCAVGGNEAAALLVFHQLVDGTLADPVELDSYDNPEPVEILDLSNDGRGDVATAHEGWEQAGVYYQRPNGTLGPEALYPIPYASSYNLKGLALGDVSGDGLNDIAIADYNSGLIVLRQTP